LTGIKQIYLKARGKERCNKWEIYVLRKKSQTDIPPEAILIGSLYPPKVSRALANAMSLSYPSPSPSLQV